LSSFNLFKVIFCKKAKKIHQWRTQHQPVETAEVSEADSAIEEEVAVADVAVGAVVDAVAEAKRRRNSGFPSPSSVAS